MNEKTGLSEFGVVNIDLSEEFVDQYNDIIGMITGFLENPYRGVENVHRKFAEKLLWEVLWTAYGADVDVSTVCHRFFFVLENPRPVSGSESGGESERG